MRSIPVLLLYLSFVTSASAQAVTASFFNQYMVDAPASASLGQSAPIQVLTITDAPIHMNIQAFTSSSPVVMVYDRAAVPGNTIAIGAWNNFNIQLDLRDRSGNGYSADQILFSGYDTPSPGTWTNSAGVLNALAILPACTTVNNQTTCITNPNLDQFEVSSQAIVFDPTNAPFNLRSTPCIQGAFDNGYEEFMLNDAAAAPFQDFKIFTFKQGFQFNFYGQSWTQVWVSSNGHVSFGGADTSFPNISVQSIRTGVPRIMSFFTDLVPEGMPYAATRVYAQQFKDSTGLTKVRIVHDHLAEFGNATGPHGGEIILTDNDNIAVYVPGYQGAPSINTGVGITPGNGVDPSVSGFGVDLSAAWGTMLVRGPGKSAFELFVPPSAASPNPIDLIGFGNIMNQPVGPGIVFLKNNNLPNTSPSNSGYIIQ